MGWIIGLVCVTFPLLFLFTPHTFLFTLGTIPGTEIYVKSSQERCLGSQLLLRGEVIEQVLYHIPNMLYETFQALLLLFRFILLASTSTVSLEAGKLGFNTAVSSSKN